MLCGSRQPSPLPCSACNSTLVVVSTALEQMNGGWAGALPKAVQLWSRSTARRYCYIVVARQFLWADALLRLPLPHSFSSSHSVFLIPIVIVVSLLQHPGDVEVVVASMYSSLLVHSLLLSISFIPNTCAQSLYDSINDPTKRAEFALSRLQIWYNAGTGLWDTAGWWNSANVMSE